MRRYPLTQLGLASACLAAVVLLTAASGIASPERTAEAQDAQGSSQSSSQQASQLKPVEPEPHDFMHYINRPTYQRLKQAIGSEPQNEEGWDSITSNALILAEAGNLLLMRAPEENTGDWNSHAVALRDSGSSLYEASQSQNFSAARRHYETMISHCNACHDDFHHGRPNLQP